MCVQVTPMVLRAEQVCTYDLDDVDQTWLNTFNGERALMGLGAVTGTGTGNKSRQLVLANLRKKFFLTSY